MADAYLLENGNRLALEDGTGAYLVEAPELVTYTLRQSIGQVQASSTSKVTPALTQAATASSVFVVNVVVDKNSGAISGPAGWTKVNEAVNASVSTAQFWKPSAGEALGTTFTFTHPTAGEGKIEIEEWSSTNDGAWSVAASGLTDSGAGQATVLSQSVTSSALAADHGIAIALAGSDTQQGNNNVDWTGGGSWGEVTDLGSAVQNSVGTAVGSGIPIGRPLTGDLLVVAFAFDNLTATTPTVQSISKPAGEQNSWQKIANIDADPTAGAGVRGELWAIPATGYWNGHTLTATLSASVAVKAMAAFSVDHTAGTPSIVARTSALPKAGTTYTGAATPTQSELGYLTGDMAIGFVVTEAGSVPAADGGTTAGSWSGGTSAYMNTFTPNTSVALRAQVKVVNQPTGLSYDPGTITDGGIVIISLRPVDQWTERYDPAGDTLPGLWVATQPVYGRDKTLAATATQVGTGALADQMNASVLILSQAASTSVALAAASGTASLSLSASGAGGATSGQASGSLGLNGSIAWGATDSFNRPNEDPLSGGGVWLTTGSTYATRWGTTASLAATGSATTGMAARYVGDVLGGTAFSRVKMGGGQPFYGPAVAMSNYTTGAAWNTQSYYVLHVLDLTNTYIGISKVENGVASLISGASYAVAVAVNDLLELRWDGTTLTGFLNGTQRITTTPTSPLAGKGVGFGSTGGAASSQALDDWVGGYYTPSGIGAAAVAAGTASLSLSAGTGFTTTTNLLPDPAPSSSFTQWQATNFGGGGAGTTGYDATRGAFYSQVTTAATDTYYTHRIGIQTVAGIPVTAGEVYSQRVELMSTVADVRSYTIDWMDASGVTIASATPATITFAANVWQTVELTAIAPANAAYASTNVVFRLAGSSVIRPVGSRLYGRRAVFALGAAATGYFEGTASYSEVGARLTSGLTGSLSLSGLIQNGSSATASVSLSAGGAARASGQASASLALAASGSGRASASGTASLALNASALVSGRVSAITVSIASPPEVRLVNSLASTATTSSFTPPANSLVVIKVAIQHDSNVATSPTLTVSDSAANSYTAGPTTYDGTASGVWIFTRYYSTSPGAITVTVNRGGVAAASMFAVSTRVLIGASSTTGSAVTQKNVSGTTLTASISPLSIGSFVEAVASIPAQTTLTRSGLDNDSTWINTGDGSTAAFGHDEVSATGAQALGWTSSVFVNFWSLALLEIQPARVGATLTLSASGSPAGSGQASASLALSASATTTSTAGPDIPVARFTNVSDFVTKSTSSGTSLSFTRNEIPNLAIGDVLAVHYTSQAAYVSGGTIDTLAPPSGFIQATPNHAMYAGVGPRLNHLYLYPIPDQAALDALGTTTALTFADNGTAGRRTLLAFRITGAKTDLSNRVVGTRYVSNDALATQPILGLTAPAANSLVLIMDAASFAGSTDAAISSETVPSSTMKAVTYPNPPATGSWTVGTVIASMVPAGATGDWSLTYNNTPATNHNNVAIALEPATTAAIVTAGVVASGGTASLVLTASGTAASSSVPTGGSAALGLTAAATLAGAGSSTGALAVTAALTGFGVSTATATLSVAASSAIAQAVAAATASLGLSASGIGQASATGTAALSLAATATARAVATATATITLAAAGTGAVPLTPTAVLALTATAAAQARATGTAALALAASTGTASAVFTAAASLSLAAAGTTAATASSSGSVSLTASATVAGAATGSASLTLAASGTAQILLPATGSASLALSAAGSGRASGSADASIAIAATLTGQGSSSATASMSLAASGSVRASAAGSAALSLAASGTAAALSTGTASVTLTASGTARGSAAGSATVALSGTASSYAYAYVSVGAQVTLVATAAVRAVAGGTAFLVLTSVGYTLPIINRFTNPVFQTTNANANIQPYWQTTGGWDATEGYESPGSLWASPSAANVTNGREMGVILAPNTGDSTGAAFVPVSASVRIKGPAGLTVQVAPRWYTPAGAYIGENGTLTYVHTFTGGWDLIGYANAQFPADYAVGLQVRATYANGSARIPLDTSEKWYFDHVVIAYGETEMPVLESIDDWTWEGAPHASRSRYARVAAPVTSTGSLSLAASGTAAPPSSGQASVSLTASGSAAGAVAATASLAFSASGTAGDLQPATATASLALSASGVARASAAGSAQVALAASGAAQVTGTGTAAVALAASGTVRAAAAGTASVTLAASGAARAVAAGSASLAITASVSPTPVAVAAGTASLVLAVNTVAAQAVAVSTAVLNLSGSAATSTPGQGSGALTVTAALTGVASSSASSSISLAASGLARASAAGTATITLTAAGSGQASASAVTSIALAASAFIPGTVSSTASLSLVASTTGQAAGQASASLGIAGALTGSAPSSATATLALAAAGTGRATAAGTASVALAASGTARGSATGTASLSLAASGAAAGSAAGTAALLLTADGEAADLQATTGTASLSLTATGATSATGQASGTLTVSGSVAAGARGAASASLAIVATGVVRGAATGSSSVLLAASVATSTPAAGAAASVVLAGALVPGALGGATASLGLLAVGSPFNLLTNPRASLNNGWAPNNGAYHTRSIDTTIFRSAPQAVRHTRTASFPGTDSRSFSSYSHGTNGQVPLTAGSTYTFSSYALAGQDGYRAFVSVYCLDAAGAGIQIFNGPTVLSPAGTWVRPSVTFTAPPNTAKAWTSLYIERIDGAGSAAGDYGVSDDALLTEGSVLYDFDSTVAADFGASASLSLAASATTGGIGQASGSLALSAAVTLVRTNLLLNPTFKSPGGGGLTGWQVLGATTTVDASAGTVKVDVTTNGQGLRTTQALGGMPVVGGGRYQLTYQVTAFTGAGSIAAGIEWWTAAGVFISSSSAGSFASFNTSNRFGLAFNAPANAAYANVTFLQSTPGAVASFTVARVLFEQIAAGASATVINSNYFDGDSLAAKWNGSPHASTSTWNPVLASADATASLSLSASGAARGGADATASLSLSAAITSLRSNLVQNPRMEPGTANYRGFTGTRVAVAHPLVSYGIETTVTTTVQGSLEVNQFPVTPGSTITVAGDYRIVTQVGAAVGARQFFFWYDINNQPLTGISGPIVDLPSDGNWYRNSFSITVPANAYFAYARLQSFGGGNGSVYQIAAPSVSADGPSYLDGTMPGAVWTGVPNQSASQQITIAAPVFATASLALSASGAAELLLPAAGTASLALSASGTAQVTATATAALSLAASGAARATATSSATLSLAASGATSGSGQASGSVTLAASGVSAGVGAASASLALTGAAVTEAPAIATGLLNLSGTAASTSPGQGAGVVAISASITPTAPSSGTASVSLTASGSARAVATGTASLALIASGAARATAAASASVSITASGAGRGTGQASASLALAAAATTSAPGQASSALVISATITGVASSSATASLALVASGAGTNLSGGTAALVLAADADTQGGDGASGELVLSGTAETSVDGAATASLGLSAGVGSRTLTNMIQNPRAVSGGTAIFSNSNKGTGSPAGVAGYDANGWYAEVTAAATDNQYTVRTYALTFTSSLPGIVAGATYFQSIDVMSTVDDYRQVAIDWLDASGVSVGSATATTYRLPANEWVRVTLIGTAPANAARASTNVIFRSTAAGVTSVIRPVGSRLYVRNAMFVQANHPVDYFDGTTPGASWTGVADKSASVLVTDEYSVYAQSSAATASIALSASASGQASASATASLTLAASGTAGARATATASLSLAASGAGRASLPTSTATLALTATGATQAPQAGSGALSLAAGATIAGAGQATGAVAIAASASSAASGTSSASLALAASGSGRASGTATGTLALSASGSARASAGGSASLSLTAAGASSGSAPAASATVALAASAQAAGSPSPTGSLSLTASTVAAAATDATATLVLSGAGFAARPGDGLGQLFLSGSMVVSAVASASAALALVGDASGRASGAATGSVAIAAAIVATASPSSTAAISLSASGTARGAAQATAALSISAFGTSVATSSASASLVLTGTAATVATGQASGTLAVSATVLAAAPTPTPTATLSLAAAGAVAGAASGAAAALTLSAAALARAAATATATVSLSASGTASVQAQATASLALSGTLAARAVSTATATVALAASGATQTSGLASGSLVISATVPASGQTSANGVLALAAQATARPQAGGTATVSLAAAGTAGARASASAALSLTGSMLAAARATGTASVLLQGSITQATPQAVATATLALSASAATSAVASGSLSLVVAASAQAAGRAGASASLTLSGQTSARAVAQASANLALSATGATPTAFTTASASILVVGTMQAPSGGGTGVAAAVVLLSGSAGGTSDGAAGYLVITTGDVAAAAPIQGSLNITLTAFMLATSVLAWEHLGDGSRVPIKMLGEHDGNGGVVPVVFKTITM